MKDKSLLFKHIRKNAKIISLLSAFVLSIIVLAYFAGYYSGKLSAVKNVSQNTIRSENNAVVWNSTIIYEEPESNIPVTSVNKGIHVIVEDVMCDYYFVRVEQINENNQATVIASGWVLTKDIRLYPDFTKQ